jgi:hypothetical protein
MSRKCNVSHPARKRSNYPNRLSARGLSKAPRLAEIEGNTGLRHRQERRVMETCTVGHADHNLIDCNGVPWPYGVAAESPASEISEYLDDVEVFGGIA